MTHRTEPTYKKYRMFKNKHISSKNTDTFFFRYSLKFIYIISSESKSYIHARHTTTRRVIKSDVYIMSCLLVESGRFQFRIQSDVKFFLILGGILRAGA